MTQDNATNTYWQNLIAIADRNGWTVLEIGNDSIRLQDSRGEIRLTIEADHGLGIPEFLRTVAAPVHPPRVPVTI